MIGTGKYDFPGIREKGAAALKALLLTTGWGAAIIASPFKPVIDMVLSFASEWLANRGLIVINVGAIYVNGEFRQDKFDQAMEEGLAKAKAPGLTDAQKKVIDEEVLQALRRFGRING